MKYALFEYENKLRAGVLNGDFIELLDSENIALDEDGLTALID